MKAIVPDIDDADNDERDRVCRLDFSQLSPIQSLLSVVGWAAIRPDAGRSSSPEDHSSCA